ncbi:pyridoxal phosphate-dependent transferase [Mycena sp. CBHHK59/15]|nr:pyridoxal phosphate-dependent transferase [Mycena sp. CBHHK59/15]
MVALTNGSSASHANVAVHKREEASWGFATRAIHVGSEPSQETGAVIPPISLSTTFKQNGVGNHKGFEYTRSQNPSRAALEAMLASIETGGANALAFASGSAATATVIQSLGQDAHIIAVNDVYGGTWRYMMRVAKELSGLEVGWVNPEGSVEEIRAALRPNTKVNIVLHSLTKYINGHSDVLLGCRGMSALRLAQTLQQHPAVEEVIYPGLATHKRHAVAWRSLSPHARRWIKKLPGVGVDGAGDFPYSGIVSVRLRGEAQALKFLEELRIFTLAESLGGVESLAEHPATMTHSSIPEAEREERGITGGLVRMSVGVEDAEDLLRDALRALEVPLRRTSRIRFWFRTTLYLASIP